MIGDLSAERDRLLAALRELEDERASGELPEREYLALRDDYTARAAAVLEELEGTGQMMSEPEGDDEAGGAGPVDETPGAGEPHGTGAAAARRRRLRVAIVVAGLVLLGGGAGLLVSAASGSRQPGQTVSGSVPPSPAQDLVAARQAMGTGNQSMALKLYQAVLQVEPDQPEALAYSGWLIRLAGDAENQPALIDQAVAAERAAEAADPNYPDAHFFLGVILLDDLHAAAAAVPQLQAYLGSHPSAAVQKAVAPVLARAQQEAAAAGGSQP
ncbi:MAG TPA: hypothetical protein VGR90_10460 [Acidimicrobiales bacterium]|nr:hypothetical protein [Acidimicrobiales bacterium]